MSETNKKQIHIVSFSGGKDSIAMLLKMERIIVQFHFL